MLGLFQPPLALPCIPTPLEIDCNPVMYPEPAARGWLTEGEEKKSVLLLLLWQKQEYLSCFDRYLYSLPLSYPTFVLLHPKPLRWKSKPFHPVLKRSQLPSWQLSWLSLDSLDVICMNFAHTYTYVYEICSHKSVITYKQSRFSLEDTKYSKSFRCGQILLRGILDQELAHQPLSFACLLGGPR